MPYMYNLKELQNTANAKPKAQPKVESQKLKKKVKFVVTEKHSKTQNQSTTQLKQEAISSVMLAEYNYS